MLVNLPNNNGTTYTANPPDLFEATPEIVNTPKKEIEVDDVVYIEGKVKKIDDDLFGKRYEVFLPTSCITINDIPSYNIIVKSNIEAYKNGKIVGEINGKEEAYNLLKDFMQIPFDIMKHYFSCDIETKPDLIKKCTYNDIVKFMDWYRFSVGDLLKWKSSKYLEEEPIYSVVLELLDDGKLKVWCLDDEGGHIDIIYDAYKYWEKSKHNLCISADNLIKAVNKINNMISNVKVEEVK